MVPSVQTRMARLTRGLLGALAGVAMLGVFGTAASARQRGEELRTVHGTVFNSANAPLPKAIVYLKNLRTMAIRTYIADGNGRYRFSGLDPNSDYQIHAEHANLTSNTRTISNYDSRHDILLNLKVNRKTPQK